MDAKLSLPNVMNGLVWSWSPETGHGLKWSGLKIQEIPWSGLVMVLEFQEWSGPGLGKESNAQHY